MSVMKQVLMVLLLVAVGSSADVEVEPTKAPDHCDGLKNKVPLKDLHKYNGEWVLFWSVSDHDNGHNMLSVLRSSHVEMSSDNITFVMTERNLYTSGPNRRDFFINETLPSDPVQFHIHADTVRLEVDGKHEDYNDTADLAFYEGCPDCMLMTYKVEEGFYLLVYIKDGKHQDAEKLKTVHDDHKKQAECLGFPHSKPYSYDGVTDFAHKKSSPDVATEAPVLERP
ncbi:saxitoxin and tetrodotoxin-binding protein 1-like [Stegastes partitus]|uniref:Saxitoxin and tetrodotoxin-binding protein 1-like n=1 Tax=Stegastes partitus TaxID=144197 RepID=A0A3B5B1J8_9TELE|nr:PREDICTED: saxitoxin and tetrodotoxin-binding protein 1-like [Stegastes partitus]